MARRLLEVESMLLAAVFALGLDAMPAPDTTTAPKERPEAAGFHLDGTIGSSARSGFAGPSGGFRFGYGFAAGAFVVGPQLSLDIAIEDDGNAGAAAAVPGVRVELPVEHFGFFLEGGIGIGAASNPGNRTADGVEPIFEIGGGLLYHVGSHFALGIETLSITAYNGKSGDKLDGGWRYGPLAVALW